MTAQPGYAYAPPPTRSRPLGVAILAVLIGIYGFLEFLFGLLIAVGSAAISSLGGSSAFHILGTSGVLAGAILAIIGLIVLGLAVGLWHLRMWALVLTLLFLIFEMVINALAGTYISFGFIVALLLFIYLLAVNRHFR
ncbi:MAG TPA: hypothetical protein VMG14_00245 [Thermoplasmata archaeon]|nr:hypothetical protein [Thermoplasmata archaeon]